MVSQLARLLGASLPDGWDRTVRIVSKPGALVFHARDRLGAWHLFEAHPLTPGRPPALAGRLLGLSYRTDSQAGQDLAVRLRVLEAWLPHEEAIAAALHTTRLRMRPTDERLLLVREQRLLEGALRGGARAAVSRLLAQAPSGPLRLYLYLESPCAQSCQFCQLPATRTHPLKRMVAVARDWLGSAWPDIESLGIADALFEGARERGARMTVTGHDWARHPARDGLIERAERLGVPLRLMGPGTALTDVNLVRRMAALSVLEGVDLTLQSVDPAVHDHIVGAPGAWRAVMEAIRVMREHGIEPGLNVVLTRDTVPGLPALVEYAATECLPLNLMAVQWEAGPRDFGLVTPSVGVLRDVLEACADTLLHAQCAFDRLPLCAVPPELRHLASGSGDMLGRADPPPCSACRLLARCPRVHHAYLRHHGESSLRPEPA